MKQRLIETFRTVSKWIPTGIYHHLVRREVISIFYHAVSNDVMAHVRHLYPVVPVSVFREALVYLKEHFNFVTYDMLQARYSHGTPLPPDAVHLSFDDGFSGCYSVVRPILLELDIPCTFFLTIDWLDNRMLYFRHQISLCVHHAKELPVTDQDEFFRTLNLQFDLSLTDLAGFTGWIKDFRTPQEQDIAEVCKYLGIDIPAYVKVNQPYLTTAQVQGLQADGFTIGAHGLTHRKLGFVPQADIETEIVRSCQVIQEITGDAIVPFSFPQSAGNVDRGLLGDILKRHTHIGLLFDTKDLRLDEGFMVNRVWAERPLTPDRRLHPIQEVLALAYRDAWVEGVIGRLRRG
jgi:peptidoglycan/xylan/chitin deacetylase (PgdA/CDA1 family)